MSDTTLNRFVASGTTAERTAFTPSVPSPASGPDSGYTWWDTDLQTLYAWDVGGGAWVPAIGSAPGGNISFASGFGLIFDGAGPNPITVVGGDDGFGDTALIIDDPGDGYVVLSFPSYTDIYFPSGMAVNNPAQFFSTVLVGQNNLTQALTLTTPDTNDVAYDTTPLAAIYINGPGSPSTRNFASGLWVVTEGGSVDKGRGIGVQNLGASDSIYIQNDGASGTGLAVLNNEACVAIVTENRHASATGAVFRQGTGGGATTVAKFEGNIAGTAELINISSNQTGKSGIVFRASGAANKAITVIDAGTATAFEVGADDGHFFSTAYFEGVEMTAPSAPAANHGRLFFRDVGGKTQLACIFNTGAIQPIATEP